MPLRPVIFVNRYFYPDESATSQILSDLAFHLAARGHSICVITSKLSYEDASVSLPTRENVRGVNVIRVATTTFGRNNLFGRAMDYLSFYISAFFACTKQAQKNDILISKTDPPLLSLPIAIAAKLKRADFGTWLQDLYPEVAADLHISLAKGIPGRLLQALRNWSLRQASFNVVIGSRMRAILMENSIPSSKVVEIPNWADDDAIRPLASTNSLRVSWGIDSNTTVVGYSGNLGRAHDLETILGAATSLRKRGDILFLFIGGGKLHTSLREKIKALSLDNVLLKPYQPRNQLIHSLTASDIHWVSLLPNLEGKIVPSKIYGIAAAGRPIFFIGEPSGEVGSMVAKFSCGATFRIGESEKLAAAISALADDKEELQSWGKNARQMIDKEYSQRLAFTKWEAVLTSADTNMRLNPSNQNRTEPERPGSA